MIATRRTFHSPNIHKTASICGRTNEQTDIFQMARRPLFFQITNLKPKIAFNLQRKSLWNVFTKIQKRPISLAPVSRTNERTNERTDERTNERTFSKKLYPKTKPLVPRGKHRTWRRSNLRMLVFYAYWHLLLGGKCCGWDWWGNRPNHFHRGGTLCNDQLELPKWGE